MVDIVGMFTVILANPTLVGLLIFGNIENLVLSSQGVVAGVDPKRLLIFSLIIVAIWIILGTFFTNIASSYADVIEFIGGLAIFILGIDAMWGAIKPQLNK